MLRHLIVTCLVPALGAQTPVGFGRHAEFVARHCFDCHGGDATKGKLDLGVEAADPVGALWRLSRMRARVRAGEMPPPDADQPTAAARDTLLRWIDATLRREVPKLPSAPGRVTIRRLNISQWQRSVRDLLGVDVETAGFPADDLGYGFDTIGDALSFSTLHFEKFLTAAGEVADRVFDGHDPDRPTVRRFEAEAMRLDGDRGASLEGDHANLYTQALLEQRLRLPRDGTYRLRILAGGDQAGDEPPQMLLQWDRRDLDRIDVPNQRYRWFELTAPLLGGDHVLGLAFTNDYYDAKNERGLGRDRNLHIDRCEVIGPLDPRAVPAAQQWIHDAVPAAGADRARLQAVAGAILPRIWRRSPTADEVARYARVGLDALAAGDDLTAALRLLLQSALASPHFLFRGELTASAGAGAVTAVPSTVLVSRLSYFLWASTPDDELLATGRRGALSDRATLLAEARRLLADARADSLATEFAAQWLELDNLGDHMPDPDRFPGFDDDLRASFRGETERLFAAVMREGRDVRELLDCDFTHVDARLAAFYGLDYPDAAEGFVRVALADGQRRHGGVLGHGSVLAVTSNPTRTSPVKRGKWILENLLGAPPPPPPPGNDSLPDEERAVDNSSSFREQLAQHRADSKCAVCHVRMDALGLALERFDPIGRYRERDAGGEIDSSGELPGGLAVAGLAGLKRVLRDDPAFVSAMARKLFVYGIGREPRPVDRLVLDHAIDELLMRGKVTVADLVLAIVGSDAFRLRVADGGR